MAANNEIEYCSRWQTLEASAARATSFSTPMRSSQANPLDAEAMKIDLMSMTAVYGP